MEIITPLSKKEFSQRKLDEYERWSKVVQWGRSNPVRFAEDVFGTQLIDFQRLAFMQSWTRQFILWLECRGAGKDTLAAVYDMTRTLLIPDYRIYVSSNTYAQSVDSFNKLRDIALKKIPSFASLTDLYAMEVDKGNSGSDTGFIQSPFCHFELFNHSGMWALSSNLEAIRGKRGAVWFNEVGWKTDEELAVVEHYIDADSSFSTSTKKIRYIDPIKMPLQIMYTSSASDAESPFYGKYKTFYKRMLIGDPNYYVFDFNAYDVLNHSSIDGEPITSHLTREQIEKSIEEDPDLADRELFNKFRRGGGANALVTMDELMRNSVARRPLLYNDTGKKRFIFSYDPARNFDGSVLVIYEVLNDEDVGYHLRVANVISFVDVNNSKKTPMPMTAQLKLIRKALIAYNGDRAAEWENIDFYIDSGAGGGGVSAVADQLMEDWIDNSGKTHRGLIDPEHDAYETARKIYKNAYPCIHLVSPQKYRNAMFDALQKMVRLNLIEFSMYDNKDYILVGDEDNLETVYLTDEEKISLANCEILKSQVSKMCRYDKPGGGVTYELAKDLKKKDHDDFAYCLAMGSYALSEMRRGDLLSKPKEEDFDPSKYTIVRQPQLRKY